MRFSSGLLNGKSDKLDLSIIAGIPQRPISYVLGTKPMEEEVTTALRSIAIAKAMRPDELLVELLKLDLNYDATVLREIHRVIT